MPWKYSPDGLLLLYPMINVSHTPGGIRWNPSKYQHFVDAILTTYILYLREWSFITRGGEGGDLSV